MAKQRGLIAGLEPANRKEVFTRPVTVRTDSMQLRRDRMGNGLLFTMALIAGVSLLETGSQAGDWPQLLGPARNGVSAETNLAETWPKAGPPVLWKRNVGQGFSGPAVAAGRLILFHRTDDQEVVECLDASTGDGLWRFPYATSYRDDFGFDVGPRATPTIVGNRVYTFGAQGLLHCLDFRTGAVLWSVDTHRRFGVRKGFFGAACSPLVDGNAVLLNVGGRDGAGLVAFHKATGKLLWKATDDEASYSSPVAATINGRRHAFFLTRSGLVDVDPETGDVGFQFPWRARIRASVNAASPLVVDDRVFISASYQTGAALLRVTGNPPDKLWSSDDVLSNHYATSVHRDGYLYGFHGRQEYGPELRCVELETGKVRWGRRLGGAGTVTLAGDRLLVLLESGELIVASASPEAFKPTARARVLPEVVRAYPALADGRLYARNKSTFVCIDLRK